MVGGGSFGWEPGEWTDDTSMAWVIAEVVASRADLREEQAQDRIAAGWYTWMCQAKDVGAQTRAVLTRAASGSGVPTAEALRRQAAEHHRRSGRSGGNGSLMRTAPVALSYLGDPEGLVEAATQISALTRWTLWGGPGLRTAMSGDPSCGSHGRSGSAGGPGAPG